jgi:hypothetical protein
MLCVIVLHTGQPRCSCGRRIGRRREEWFLIEVGCPWGSEADMHSPSHLLMSRNKRDRPKGRYPFLLGTGYQNRYNRLAPLVPRRARAICLPERELIDHPTISLETVLDFSHKRLMKQFTASIVLLMSLACANLLAQGKIDLQTGDTILGILQKNVGQSVELRMTSGEKIAGKVEKVGDKVVHLSQLTGAEFFDAAVDVANVEAVVVRTKSK